jgi:hypothetical protein
MNDREYQRKSGQRPGSSRPILSVVIFAILIIISIPLACETMIDWYKYVPLIMLFLVVTIFLGRQAYQGLIERHVQIFPQRNPKMSSEAGYVGDKTSNYVSGTAAQIAGGIFLVLGMISFGLGVKYTIALMRTLF